MASVYEINKGVNKAIEFKGLKAQYIAYLAVGLVGLLILFAVAYIAGVPVYISLGIIMVLGFGLFTYVGKYSHKYGQYGLMKEAAYKRIPPAIVCRSRKKFFDMIKVEVRNGSGDSNGSSSDSSVHVAAKGR